MLSFSACKVPEPLKPGKVKKDVPINAKEEQDKILMKDEV